MMLDQILYDFFEVEPPAAGQDLAWSLGLPAAWADWITLGFLVAAITFFVVVYRKDATALGRIARWSLVALRLGVLLMILLMLWEWDLRIDRRGLPYLTLAIDDSQSMALSDLYQNREDSAVTNRLLGESPTRMAVAKALLTGNEARMLVQMTRGHRLRVYSVSEESRAVGEFRTAEEIQQAGVARLWNIAPVGHESRIGDGLRNILNDLGGSPPTALVLVSDGINTSGEQLSELARYATLKAVPVYVLAVGDSSPVKDLELRNALFDEVAFVDDTVHFDALIEARGLADAKATVELVDESSDTILSTEVLDITQDGNVPVQLQYTPTNAGQLSLQMRVQPLPGETRLDNNSLPIRLEVQEQKTRVLLVESYPRFEYKFIKHLLERDPSIDLKVILLEADPRFAEQDRSAIGHFPTTAGELTNYDVLLFGDVNPTFLDNNQLTNIRDFALEKGGGIAFLAGPRYMPRVYADSPIASIMPIDFSALGSGKAVEGFQPRISIEGMSHPIYRLAKSEEDNQKVWSQLPDSFWFFELLRQKPGSSYLAVHPAVVGEQGPLPLFISQQVGAGKVFMSLIDSTWRWREQVRDLYIARFWIQLIRHLSRSPLASSRQIELTTDRREYIQGQSVYVQARVWDESLLESSELRVMVERDGGSQSGLSLKRLGGGRNLFEAVFTNAHHGGYRVWLVDPALDVPPATSFQVSVPEREKRKIEMAEADLKRLAQSTGGHYFTPKDAHQLARRIPPGRKIPLDVDPPILLWNRWGMLIAFLIFLAAEWLLRKRMRLL